MMFYYLVAAATMASVLGGYSGSGSSSSAGNGVDGGGTGYGYGFSGTTGTGAGNFGGNFPQPPLFDFNSVLQQYFESLRRYQEQFQASLLAAHQNAIQGYGGGQGFPGGGYPGYGGAGQGGYGAGGFGAGGFGGGGAGGYGGVYNAPGGGVPDGAAYAGGAIGPGGGYGGAAVYPENANSPNIFNRFGEGTGQASGGPVAGNGQPGNGFYGVFSSSSSHTSDVDGKKVTVQEAQTTVNDNGNITTYKARNP